MRKLLTNFLSTLQGQINISLMTIVILAVVSFMFISIKQSSTSMQEMSTDFTIQLVEKVNDNIESYISAMDNIGLALSNDPNVRNYLFSKLGLEKEENMYASGTAGTFRMLRTARPDIYNIGAMSVDGKYMINDRSTKMNPYSEVANTDWYRRAIGGETVVTSSHVQNVVQNRYDWVITYSRQIKNLVDDQNNAVLFIDMKYSNLIDQCEGLNLGEKGYAFILDGAGNLVYHPRQQLIYSGLYTEDIDLIMNSRENIIVSEDGSRYFTVARSGITGWSVVAVTYADEMVKDMKRTRFMYYLMALILIGISLMISMIVTDSITSPLRNIRHSMRRVEEGNFAVALREDKTTAEIQSVVRAFNKMTERIQELMAKSISEQEEIRKSELKALQAQIKPHFLYNTLDSIIWMAEGGENRDVVLMTSALSKLLRRSISNQAQQVTIREEIEYVQSYLLIQKMRYKDKLEYEIQVDPSIYCEEIPKLTIQPIVENAIYHGIKNKESGKGMLRIEGGRGDGCILISVIDNGAGMPPEKAAAILTEKQKSPAVKTEAHESMGIRNVHRRIVLSYGREYGLRVESRQGVGTRVDIYLPDPYRTFETMDEGRTQ